MAKKKTETKVEQEQEKQTITSELEQEVIGSQETAESKEDQQLNEEENIEVEVKDEAPAVEEDPVARLESEVSEWKDKYVRLSAEFDNYRRRTLKEKMELTKTAGENVLVKVLPVADDFERAIQSMQDAKDCTAILEGVDLIYHKFKEFLNQQGVKTIDAMHTQFDTDIHEALTKIPAPKKKLKGKVVDVIEKGYTLNDKVIRFSKVVVGE